MAGIFRFTTNGDYNEATSSALQFVGGSVPLSPLATTSFDLSFGSFGILGYHETGSSVTSFLNISGGGNIATYSGGLYFNFSDGNAAVTFGGGKWGDTMIGGSAGDLLDGAAGDDTLDGGDGNDTVQGSAGDDTMKGGRGNDVLTDLIGSNFMDGGEGTDTLSFAGGGAATVDMTQGYALQLRTDRYAINTFVSIENLLGSSVGDRLTGDDKANDLTGAGGNDVLGGGGGVDRLQGGTGNDSLSGGDGNDRLQGNGGADQLTGGAGADRFLYEALGGSGTAGGTRDHILDFRSAQGDRIDLSAIDANTANGAGNDAFKLVSVFSGGGELRVTAHGAGEWIVTADADGDKVADMVLLVNSPAILTAADFVL